MSLGPLFLTCCAFAFALTYCNQQAFQGAPIVLESMHAYRFFLSHGSVWVPLFVLLLSILPMIKIL